MLRMTDHRHCRFSASDGVLELAGPPAALRSLSRLLRQHAEPCEVPITGGSVAQQVTSGPLRVSLRDMTTLHLGGSLAHLDIIWDALDDVAEDAETTEKGRVNRHQHIEYYPGDTYRSPDSMPLIIMADWPAE